MVANACAQPARRTPVIPLAFLVAVAAVLLAIAAREAVAPPVDVEVQYTDHATKHPEAPQVRRCLEQNRADSVWRSRSWKEPFKFLRTCRLPDGRIGLQILRWSWRELAWKEITSFVVKAGTEFQTLEYLKAISYQVK